jgi:cytochrome c oxidase subunit 3
MSAAVDGGRGALNHGCAQPRRTAAAIPRRSRRTRGLRRSVAAQPAGLWLFFVSEAFLFGGLLATRFYLWGADTRPELDQMVGLIVTSVLLISSARCVWRRRRWSAATAASSPSSSCSRRSFGLVFFLGGVMIFEWGLFPSIYQGHLTPWDNKYGAVVFAMTGMHALHVLSGIVFIF